MLDQFLTELLTWTERHPVGLSSIWTSVISKLRVEELLKQTSLIDKLLAIRALRRDANFARAFLNKALKAGSELAEGRWLRAHVDSYKKPEYIETVRALAFTILWRHMPTTRDQLAKEIMVWLCMLTTRAHSCSNRMTSLYARILLLSS